MGEHVERAGVEDEPERLLVLDLHARGLPWRRLAVVGDLGERMTLILCLRLDAQPLAHRVIVRDLEPIIQGLTHRAASGIASLGSTCLEQVEFPAVVSSADVGGAMRAVDAERAFAVHREEAGILELALRCLDVEREPTGRLSAPAVAAPGSLDHSGRAELRVVRSAVGFNGATSCRLAIGGEGECRGYDIDYASKRFRSVQHARRSSNHFNPLRQSRVDRRAVLVAPRVVLESAAIGEDKHARSEEPADHWLAHLLAGGNVAHAGELRHGVRERDAAGRMHIVAGEDARRER